MIFQDFPLWLGVAFPKDRWHAKSLVVFIYAIETAQMLIMTNDCWNAYVDGFGDVPGLDNVQNEWLAAPVFTAIGKCPLLGGSAIVELMHRKQ